MKVLLKYSTVSYQLEKYIFGKFHDEQRIIDNQFVQYNRLSLVINNSVLLLGQG